jgi:hypothetical protein
MSLPPVISYVDYEVSNEPWNRYKLLDGTLLRSRLIVAQIIKSGQYDPYGKPQYGILAQTLNTIEALKNYAPIQVLLLRLHSNLEA